MTKWLFLNLICLNIDVGIVRLLSSDSPVCLLLNFDIHKLCLSTHILWVNLFGKYDVVILCAAVRLRRGAAMETAELFVSILWSGGCRLPWRGEGRRGRASGNFQNIDLHTS